MGSDVVNEIFAEGSMITLARIVLAVVALMIVVACIYAIASICIRMLRREWLKRAGGFEPELRAPSRRLATIATVAKDLGGLADDNAEASPPSTPEPGKEHDMTDELRQMYVAEIERLREENRRLIASEAALRAKQQVSGRIIGQLAREAQADLQRIAARH